MSWISLTETDLDRALNAEERELYSEHASTVEQPVRAPGILADVVAQVRGDIESCERNQLSQDETLIPKAYKLQALAIARFELLNSIPYCEISDSRVKSYDRAIKFFESVANCKRRPKKPDDARDNEAASEKPLPGAQVVHSRPNITGRDNLSGL